ncbi:glycosyltransferase family A protein [Roseimicrobium sp. ORNL1]|uniref:glycosyltransferase family 2 protein n=1 Tax=Roseimicrobium sp. ORNL1 TaxID=2711231 RepID=UPI0013E11D7C|nr:glycosyltransferase family A protein [Roseimicrobium sp. ORNL1]QIF04482.1 glycosyltransferase family 2 protein [Roseimicrobium sp. ORNL1]
MLFSIIIPTYNRIEYLKATLDSVWQQTFQDFEVIVVDDGSTDGTAAYLSSLEGKVSLIQQSNAGPGAARNRGAEAARGEYVVFLDSDDLWFPWTLELTAEIINSVGRPSFISGRILPFSDPAELQHVSAQPLQYRHHPDYLSAGSTLPFAGSCAMIVRRDTFMASGGFLQGKVSAEDHDLALRMGVAGGFVEIMAPTTVGYRRHTTNITGSLLAIVEGIMRLLQRESSGVYPGGNTHKKNRHQILGSHLRPVAIACAKAGLQSQGWELYRKSFLWHVTLLRLKFLFGFPLISLRSMFTK